MASTLRMITPTLNEMAKDLPMHQNFYVRGIVNAFLPAFMNPYDKEITASSLNGEALEMLRTVVEEVAGDLPEGFVTSISYEDINEKFNLQNAFNQSDFDLTGFPEQIKMALGGFNVERKDGKLTITDKYDFPPKGEWKMYSNLEDAGDYIRASAREPNKRKYFAARFLGERFMTEGRDDILNVNIELPSEAQVIDIDFDDDPPAEAGNFVFRGDMTNKRKTLWDSFTSMLVTPAKAQTNDNVKQMTDLQQSLKLMKAGKQPFPMDGNDEQGRLSPTQRAILEDTPDYIKDIDF